MGGKAGGHILEPRPPKTKPLDYKSMTATYGIMMESYNKQSADVRLLVSAVMIKLQDLVVSGTDSTQGVREDGDGDLSSQMRDTIAVYNSAFLPKANAFLCNRAERHAIVEPHKSNVSNDQGFG